MIFAGKPVKFFHPPYASRCALMEMRERKSLEEFLRDVWTQREPVTPYSRGKWPISRDCDAVESVVKMRAAR